MATVATGRDLSSTLDPHLFTFKPKLNAKSYELAQNLCDFYQRQLQHVKRTQELQDAAANDYRHWYSRDRRHKHHKNITETKSNVDETLVQEENGSSSIAKDMQPSNDRIDRLFRIYRSPVPRKAGLPAVVTEPRPPRTLPRRSAPPAALTTEPATPAPPPPPATASVVTRLSRRTSPNHRSKVVRPVDSSPKRCVVNENINTERLKLARDEAERAMKDHKIFTIIGPYPALREALRRRGWIEKFDRAAILPNNHGNQKKSDKKTNKSDDDDDDDTNLDELTDDALDESPMYDDEDRIPPWEENDGYYGILSRLVKSAPPDFIWSVQASYDTSTLNKDQMVNHYSRNGCLTTKVGLCSSLRNLQWFHSGCADEFYPRCYKLTNEDDKVAFIDDYRLTACISFLRLCQNRARGILEPDMNSILAMNSDETEEDPSSSSRSYSLLPSTKPNREKSSARKKVPSSLIEFALKQVENFTLSRDHDDIDRVSDPQTDPNDDQWTQFIDQFYAASHSYAEIEGMDGFINQIDRCLKAVEQHWPQYHIDGTRNIWILKPGAKSRGRGIVVYDRLEDILKLCSSSLISDRKFVVQKYIERPLLIHNTKFDIRQWFLVTDWNPLTIWMFKDCYFRFCTEHFSLETRQQNVHLCNYSIQKHFKNNANRHSELPVENMWTNKEFIEKYLRPINSADKWESLIYPEMKDAIICSMLVAQDSIDPRKNSFELFGADFMLGEDLKPWLIEINCSPTMARCTAVTTEMCDSVLEDTCKVMIDRKYSRSNDTGRFELIHKGSVVPVPTYVGIDLRVEGKSYKSGRNHQLPPVNIPKTNFPSVSDPPVLQSSHSPQTLDTDHDSSPNNSMNLQRDDGGLSSDGSNEETSFHARSSGKPINRITVDSLSIHPIGRNKASDRPPATQTFRTKRRRGSKLNRAEFLLRTGQEVKNSEVQLPFYRRLQKKLLSPYHNQQDDEHQSLPPSLLQRQKANLNLLAGNKQFSRPSTASTATTGNEQISIITIA